MTENEDFEARVINICAFRNRCGFTCSGCLYDTVAGCAHWDTVYGHVPGAVWDEAARRRKGAENGKNS